MQQRITSFCLCVFIAVGIISCNKSRQSDPVDITAITFPSHSDMPYDTSHVAAAFSSELLYDSVNHHREANLYFTAWFPQNVTDSFVNVAVVNANGRQLTRNGRTFMAAVGKFVPTDNFRPDTTVSWAMSGSPDFTFSYTNTDSFPEYKVPLPDTLVSGKSYNFYFDNNTTHNVDFVQMRLIVPTNDTSSTVTLYYGPPGNPVILNDDLVKTLSGKKIGILISVFNHRTAVQNNNKYIFVKEYTYGRNVWFKQ